MSKIKNIHCFGTSFTAGGGFEWGSEERHKLLEKLYGHLDEEKTQYNYSWPGQLQKLLNEKNHKIKVYNHAQSGYGIDTLIRKVFDVVTEVGFEKDKNLFLLEFSAFNRKEYYCNEIGDFLVGNYRMIKDIGVSQHLLKDIKKFHVDMAHSYFYDNSETIKKIDKFQPTVLRYFNQSFNEDVEFKRIARLTSFFLTWLKHHKIEVIFSSMPRIYISNDWDFIETFETFLYDDTKLKIDTPAIYEFISMYNLQISYETDFLYEDFHSGIGGNKIISKIGFNYLIKKGYINGEYFDIKKELSDYSINMFKR